MDEFQLAALAVVRLLTYHRFQRREDEGERRAELMAHIGEEIQLQLVQLLRLLHTIFHASALKLQALALHHPAAIEIECTAKKQDIDDKRPDREIERRRHVDLQFADLIIHRAIAIHHLHLQGIAARRKIGEGNLRTTHRSEEPLIAYSLHAIEETATCRNRHLAGSQLDGEGMILVAQGNFTAGIQRLLHHYPALVLLACRKGMVEEHQSAEERTDMRLPGLRHTRADDVHAIQTSYGDIATMQQTDRTIVELPLLQSVERIVIGHLQVPTAILVLLYIDMSNPIFGNQPDVVLLVLDDGTTHGPWRAIQIIDRLHLVGMGIIHGNTGRGSYPEKSATIEHGIVDRRTDEWLSAKGMIQVLYLAISEIEDRHILGMAQQRLMGILNEDGADIIGRQLGIAGMIGSKLLGGWIENLESSAQGTYQQAMIGRFGETPHAVAAESAGAGMIGFPHAMGIACQSTIIGTEIEGAIVHGGTADHHLGSQSRF